MQNKYFTAGQHIKDVTGLDKDGIVPVYLPLAKKYFKSLKNLKSVSAQTEKSRKEKQKIEDVVIFPMASLGSTSATQVCTRTETSWDTVKDNNVQENVDESISADVTTIVSLLNKDNFFTSLVTSSKSSCPKKVEERERTIIGY